VRFVGEVFAHIIGANYGTARALQYRAARGIDLSGDQPKLFAPSSCPATINSLMALAHSCAPAVYNNGMPRRIK
jgi:hypothetical protein